MLRELIARDVYVFTSELYAQVTAGAIITPAGAIVIDTLAFPSETQQILDFVEQRHGVPVTYVVNTHYHADHTYGTCLFEGAQVVGHVLTRELLDGAGRAALLAAQRGSRELAHIDIRLPDVVFDEGVLNLHLGGVTLKMWHMPGHSADGIVCLVEGEDILFASDIVMPVPFFADGSWHDTVSSLRSLRERRFETVVQGHGEVILRGEMHSRLDEDLHYLYTLRDRVAALVAAGEGQEALASIDIEECGKSRIGMNGLVQQLHMANAEVLYRELLAAASGGTRGTGEQAENHPENVEAG